MMAGCSREIVNVSGKGDEVPKGPTESTASINLPSYGSCKDNGTTDTHDDIEEAEVQRRQLLNGIVAASIWRKHR
jgi:hypothetical protein